MTAYVGMKPLDRTPAAESLDRGARSVLVGPMRRVFTTHWPSVCSCVAATTGSSTSRAALLVRVAVVHGSGSRAAIALVVRRHGLVVVIDELEVPRARPRRRRF